MKEIIIKRRAEKAILRLVEFIESQNTEGAGARWYASFRRFVELRARYKFSFPLCRNENLRKYGYSCVTFKRKWIVAFKRERKRFIVYMFIYASRFH